MTLIPITVLQYPVLYVWLIHTASHIYCMVLKLLIGPLLNYLV